MWLNHGLDECRTATVILTDGTLAVMSHLGGFEKHMNEYDSKLGRDQIDYLRVVAPMPAGQGGDGSMASPPSSALIVTAANSRPEELHAWSIDHQGRSRDELGGPALRLQQLNTIDLSGPALPSGTGLGLARDGTAAVGYGDGWVVSLNVHHRQRPPIRTHTHDDEVWDVTICGDLCLSTGRDRRLTAVTRTGREFFRRDVGWVVRVKATPDKIWLLGFDAALIVLERDVRDNT